MASSSSSTAIPAPEAVQVLVSLLADESTMVRETSMASLQDIGALNPLLVLDCCAAVSRGGRRRFGNIAGLFQVMAFAVRALDKADIDAGFMSKLARIATAEMISSKELNADWQRAASGLLVSIGSHFPDLMMDEIFIHVSGSSSALPAMVQVLADFSSNDALLFTPRLKAVLSRVLPILGSVRDVHRPIFANAFKCWCQAVSQYKTEFPSHEVLDADVMSFLNSAFELLLRVWATSRDLKIPVVYINQYTTQVLGVIVALLEDSHESVQLTAVSCLLAVLSSSPSEAIEPILLNLSLRLRNLQPSINAKMRAAAVSAFGVLSSFAVGSHREAFLDQVHAFLPRLVLHLHDDDLRIRQACRSTLKQISSFVDLEETCTLLTTHYFYSDHRGDYEDFVRDLTRHFCQHMPYRLDSYMASAVQAYDAPWPTIQANAIHFSSSMLSHTEDQRILALYCSQVFGMLVGKMNRSPDTIVRAACSSSLGMLLKSSNSLFWRSIRLDQADSSRKDS